MNSILDTGVLESAADFYSKSPDGQYDKEAAEVIRRYLWLREHPAWETESFLGGLTPEQFDAELAKAIALWSVR